MPFTDIHSINVNLRNMVMALKELSIKSDFRTTIEFLITILEMEEFCHNDYDIGERLSTIKYMVKV